MITALVLGCAAAAILGSSSRADAKIDDLTWMVGAWKCEIWGGTFEEHWLTPKGGTMQGVGRHLDAGKTSFMEFLSIEPSDKGLCMWIMVGAPSKGDKHPVPFTLTKSGKGEAIFENKDHDFPNKITYTKQEAGKMLCIVEGAENGKDRKEEFRFELIR